VGNWPGVTVERKEALFQMGEDEVTLTDLPGVYSLSPYSIEENITRHFIAQHRPDVVLNIVDATNLERNLFLTLQLMELERPLVIALNLMDEIERHGGKIDCDRLSQLLGAPVVPISAKKRTGLTNCSPRCTGRPTTRWRPAPFGATTPPRAWRWPPSWRRWAARRPTPPLTSRNTSPTGTRATGTTTTPIGRPTPTSAAMRMREIWTTRRPPNGWR
jgi:hypothetical protein